MPKMIEVGYYEKQCPTCGQIHSLKKISRIKGLQEGIDDIGNMVLYQCPVDQCESTLSVKEEKIKKILLDNFPI